jgi:hypothetical protein
VRQSRLAGAPIRRARSFSGTRCRLFAGRRVCDGDFVGHRFAGDAIVPVDPVGEVQQLAAFAAERPVHRLDWMSTTVYTDWPGRRLVGHDENVTSVLAGGAL